MILTFTIRVFIAVVWSICFTSMTAYADPTDLEVSYFSNLEPLCQGECTRLDKDVIVDINGGTGPYVIEVTLEYSDAQGNIQNSVFARDNINSIHAFRICNQVLFGGDFIEFLADDISILHLSDTNFPYTLSITSVTDIDGCEANIINSTPIPLISQLDVYVDYTVDIPSVICDSIRLPEITSNIQPVISTPTAGYFTGPNGTGVQYFAGDLIDFNNINLPNGDVLDSLYIFDPNDPCMSEKLYTFFILPSPDHDIPNNITICDFYILPDFSGNVISPSAVYSTDRNFGLDNLKYEGDTLLETTLVYVGDTTSFRSENCTFLDSFFVEVNYTSFAGLDTTLLICAETPYLISDPIELLRGADPGGIWGGTQIPDVIFPDPRDIDLSHMTPGLIYQLIYTIEDRGCGLSSAQITIQAIEQSYAGIDTILSICKNDSNINFYETIGNASEGGNWVQTEGSTIVIPDYNNVDLSLYADGNYMFEYSIDNDICGQESASLSLGLYSVTDAGIDNQTSVCKGDSIDLYTLLSSGADTTGVFLVDGVIPLADGLWDSNMVLNQEGEFEILYIVPSSPNCNSDTSFFDISLIAEPFAGVVNNIISEVCEGDTLHLSDFLIDAQSGGQYYLADFSSSLEDTIIAPSANIEIAYVVGSQGTCGADTSYFEINNSGVSSYNLMVMESSLCNNDDACTQLIINPQGVLSFKLLVSDVNEEEIISIETGLLFGQQIYTLCLEEDLSVMQNDTIFIDNKLASYTIQATEVFNENNCPGVIIPALDFSVKAGSEEFFYGSVCSGETTTIDGTEYGASTQLIYTSDSGCDSIVHIVIDTFPQEIGYLLDTICAGETYDIFNMTLVPSGDLTEIILGRNESSYGCDSLLELSLKVLSESIGTIDTTLCEGSSIIIDGVTLDQSGTSNIAFPGQSKSGCDSTTIVTLSILSPSELSLDYFICDVDSAFVYDQMYSVDGLPESISVQSLQGCDSLIVYPLYHYYGDTIHMDIPSICSESDPVIITFNGSNNSLPADLYINGQLHSTFLEGTDIVTTQLLGIIGENTISVKGAHCTSTRVINISPLNTETISIDTTSISKNIYLLSYQSSAELSQVSWSGSTQLDCIACEETELSLQQSQTIYLDATTVEGCTIQDSIFLRFDESRELFIPSALAIDSPGNNTFYIQSDGEYTIDVLSIYDRWGNLVYNNQDFRTNDIAEGWDGYSNRKPVEQGVFVYRIEYSTTENQSVQEVGHITVLR